MSVQDIRTIHPRPLIADFAVLARCLDEYGACEASCTICADACLAEDDVTDMVRCIRLCLDCADACAGACAGAVRILGRQTDPIPQRSSMRWRRAWQRAVRAPTSVSATQIIRALPPLCAGVPAVRASVRATALCASHAI